MPGKCRRDLHKLHSSSCQSKVLFYQKALASSVQPCVFVKGSAICFILGGIPLVKEGYRDGVEAGKELALQEGFNQGYRHGAELMVTCGQFRGTLNALLSWCHLNGRDSALSEINNLLDVVGKHEEDVLEYLNSIEQQPQLGQILDSVQDMDLNHTAPAGTEHDEVKAGKHKDIGSFGENFCRNNGEVGSLQCSRAKLCTDPERSTLAWVKKQTIWLVEQLGLSLDILHHVQQLEP
uniref:YAE1 maturation factor of ABCE1 n=1 Tax=Calidris pygmaea TaxID=425635 RepID=A0A8C3JHU1_9CHAR